jgi:hypothetical protein
VRLPFYGSPLKLLRIGKRFYAGLNRYRDFYIYTNRGLGTYWLRIRINCRPEVSRFHLTPLDDASCDASDTPTRSSGAAGAHTLSRARPRQRRVRRRRAS